MNEEDLHLAKAIVEMDLHDSPKTPRKTVIAKLQEKQQNFSLLVASHEEGFKETHYEACLRRYRKWR
ncbi:hypothetical protein LSTR_LSTR001539, partial [Laodelphax striatellus]